MKVFQISREYAGLASGGGLGQVVAGIADALAKKSIQSSVFIPLYGFIERDNFKKISTFILNIKNENIKVVVYNVNLNGVNIYMLSFPAVETKRSIYTYSKADLINYPKAVKGDGYKDNYYINIVFQLAVLDFINRELEQPDIMVLHDAHTGFIPGIIKSNSRLKSFFYKSKLFFLIHNAGEIYHQKISYKLIKSYKIIKKHYLKIGKTNKEVSPLLIASALSTPLTVSPYYAKELLSGYHAQNDGGYGGFLKKSGIEIIGITNGIDLSVAYGNYDGDIKSLILKIEKNSGLEKYGEIYDSINRPLFLFQNRITEQKGIEELIKGISRSLKSGIEANFIVMGEGESRYEKKLIEFVSQYKGNVMYIDGYEESMAKNLFYLSDFFLLTSKWEPCGLTDMEASLFRTIPIVHDTGGLKKVLNGVTGFKYSNLESFNNIIKDLTHMFYTDADGVEKLKDIGLDYVRKNYSWDRIVETYYIPLFSEIMNE